MGALPIVGPIASTPYDVVGKGYVDSLLAQNPSQPQVNAMVAGGTYNGVTYPGFSAYVTKAYVDQQDALLATKVFIDGKYANGGTVPSTDTLNYNANGGDATRLHTSRIGAALGVVPLVSAITGDSQPGQMLAGYLSNVTSLQRFPKPYYSPAAYNATEVSASSSAVALYTCLVADPGFTYKLLITGMADNYTVNDGQYAIVSVRQGSANGPLVAQGRGLSEHYAGGFLDLVRDTPGSFSYTPPAWAASLDVVLLGGGAGGHGGGLVGHGDSGGAGSWTTHTITGPSGTYTGTVGSGGAGGDGNVLLGHPGDNGTSSTLTSPALSAAGGTAGDDSSPGTLIYNDQSYVGGAAASGDYGNPSPPGNAPGGGGLGGLHNGTGGEGASGAVWFLAYPARHRVSGPVAILPVSFTTQPALTGATTLYVSVVSSGGGQVGVTERRPSLRVIPVPV